MNDRLDKIDKKLLNRLQRSFPLAPEPFLVLGNLVGIPEEEALDRVKRLVSSGVIRRIGAVFDTKRMGFVSTLVTAAVPEEKLPEFVAVVNSFRGVTHNYRRNHRYNVWLTLIAASEEELSGVLAAIGEKTGITDILSLRSERTFKIDARFEFDEDE